MTVRPGFPAVSGAATFQDIRRSFGGMVAKSAAGVLRSGILPIGTGPLMVGTASMTVNVQTCVVVLDRNGAVFLPNDGVQAVQLSSAPSSGSRWSVIYAKQRETEAPFSDTVAGPLIDKVESTTSETAARNQLPAGARELGVWKVDAGATTTNAASGVAYTETVPYTAMEGGVVLLRNQVEQDAWAPHDGALAARLDTGALLERVSGAWAFAVQRKTAFTPNWENLLVGSGTNVGEYSIVGDRCTGEARMQFGSGYSLNSNAVLLNPPVTPRDIRADTPVGQVVILDAGQGWVAGWLMLTSAGKFELRTYGSPYSGVVNGTGSPFNFASSDVISVIFDYRV